MVFALAGLLVVLEGGGCFRAIGIGFLIAIHVHGALLLAEKGGRVYPVNVPRLFTLSTVQAMTITPAQCRMARAALTIGVRDLARMADVSAMTVTRFENGKSAGSAETLDKLKAALETCGLEFTNGDQPGVKLRKATGGIVGNG